MYELASAMPGFVSYKEFKADDGEILSLVEFPSEPELAARRNHPEHLEIQRIGRERMFQSIQQSAKASLYLLHRINGLRSYEWGHSMPLGSTKFLQLWTIRRLQRRSPDFRPFEATIACKERIPRDAEQGHCRAAPFVSPKLGW